jgi:hypothetical protein
MTPQSDSLRGTRAPGKLRTFSRPPRRRGDWETRLAAWLASVAQRPHAYGSHDCIMASLAAVRAVTGRDYGRGHRRRYGDAEEARAYLAALGFASPAAAMDSLLPRKAPAFAQRGDIVLVRRSSPLLAERLPWHVPAVCIGGEAVWPGEAGLVSVPRSEWLRAWRVG